MKDRNPVNVGARIRELRKDRGLSLRALAELSGLSLNAVSRIERGESSPTVASLFSLATALQVHIADLFTTELESSTILVRRNQRLRSRGAGLIMESLGIGLPGQILEPFLMTIDAGAEGIDIPCSHPGEEFVHCIEGEIEYQVDEAWHRLEAGDSLLFQAKLPHRYRNTSLHTAIVLLILASTEQEPSLSQQQHLMTIQGRPDENEPGGFD
jgi:transcriptional regulator with XRE-family HTH domain